MGEVRRAGSSGGLSSALLALVAWRPGLPHRAWALVTLITASAVSGETVGLVREHRGGGGDR